VVAYRIDPVPDRDTLQERAVLKDGEALPFCSRSRVNQLGVPTESGTVLTEVDHLDEALAGRSRGAMRQTTGYPHAVSPAYSWTFLGDLH
jgi:hypothetical protein